MARTKAAAPGRAHARALTLALALAVLLLACAAPLFSSAETFVNPDGSVSTVTAGGLVMLTQYTTINIASETRIAPIVDQSQKLYKASFPTWDYSVLSMSNDDALSRMANGTSDIAFRTRPLISTQATANPDLLQYPLWAEPVVVAYNPVSSKVPTTPWAIQRAQVCQILTGGISRFNQTGAAASADVFFVPIIADSTSAIQVMMRAFCSKVAVALPTNLPANVTQVAASPNELVGAAVARTPNAIGFMRLSVARLYNLKVLSMVNVATKTVTASMTSTQVATNDLAAYAVTTTTSQLDLFDSPNQLAWPLILTGYAVIPRQFSRATCAMRYEVMSFLLWFIQSNAVSAIANDNFVYMFSKDLITLMNLITRWRTEVFCDGVVVLPTPRASIVGGVDAARTVANVFLDYYATIDTSYRYAYSSLTSSAAVIGLLNTASTTVDVAVVSPMDTNQTVNSSTNAPMSSIASRGGIVFPAFVVGAMPTFVLPAPVAALLTQPPWTTVLPLIIDIPTLSNVFQGVITSWLDPALVALNPLLDDVFSAAGATAMANFTVVICCSATDDPLTATNTFATSLSVYSSSFSALAPKPMSWLPILRNVPNSNVSGSTTSIATLTAIGTSNFYYESYESRIFPRMTSLGSAIGYQQIATSTADDTYMFRVVSPALAQSLVGTDSLASYLISTGSSISGTLVPLATPAAMQQCISDSTLNVQTSVLDLTSGAVSTACWPLSVLTSFVVPASYSSIGVLGPLSSMRTDSCVRGKSALTLAGWLFSDSSVVSASAGWGVVRVGDVASSAATSAVTGLLNGVVCDATTLLVTPAESWSMASWLKVVGIAVPAVFEVVCLATLLIVLVFRNKAVLKSASVGFLVIILAGLFMLGLSAQMWVSSPGTSTCTSLVWLACIGLTLTFSPLFLKTWRIWKIFERKQLKVVKITNRRLGLMLAVHLAVDVVVLVLWTALAQPGPTTRQVLSGAKYVSYDMCSWSGSTVPFLAVQAVTKGLLFLFGALMSFSTRKVESTFNESQSVAWSVYNVLFSLAIVVPIVYVVDAVGDTLVTLILLLALWVSICTWCFIFLPKLQVLYTGLDANISQSSQSFSSEAPGFSFVSLSNLDKVMLAKYITQLTTHLVQAKKRMQQLGGMPANATSAGDTGAGMGANSQAWGGGAGAGGAGGGAGNSMLGKGGAAVESPGPVSRMGAAMVSPNRGTFAEPKKSTFTSGSGGGGGSRYVNPVSTTARSGVASFRT